MQGTTQASAPLGVSCKGGPVTLLHQFCQAHSQSMFLGAQGYRNALRSEQMAAGVQGRAMQG